jgi:hypothetical protein
MRRVFPGLLKSTSLIFKKKVSSWQVSKSTVDIRYGRERNKKGQFFYSSRRSRATLEPLIRQRILSRTHIISDKWAVYGFLADDSDYFYDRVNHSNNFVDPENRMIHTQRIESCWMHCKRLLRN